MAKFRKNKQENGFESWEQKNDINGYTNTNDIFSIPSAEEVASWPAVIRTLSASDYAIANGAKTSRTFICADGKKTTIYSLRDSYNNGNDPQISKLKYQVINFKGEKAASIVDNRVPADVVMTQITVEEMMKRYKPAIASNGRYYVLTSNHLVYPQRKVEDGLAEQLESYYRIHSPSPSGQYVGAGFSKIYEYTYPFNKQKYVRIEVNTSNDDEQFNDGTKVEDGKVYWFQVEPIKWVVLNYDFDLLKKKNAMMKLRSETALLGGIPFYEKSGDINGNLYQNSAKRAVLNKISIEDELKKNNGNDDFSAQYTYDFSNEENSFCDTFIKATTFITSQEDEQKVTKEDLNPFGLTVTQKPMTIDEQIRYYIENGKSFMLHGVSGVGKTRRVKEVDPDCVMIKLRSEMLPEEVDGKTAFEDGKPSWIPPGWYEEIWKVCSNDPNHNHVLLIDELTNVGKHEQGLVWDIILEHFVKDQSHKLPPNCVVVATGNSPEESIAAYVMAEPLFRRFYAHITLKPDVRAFLEWGGGINPKHPERTKVHPAVLSFIAATGIKCLFTDYHDGENDDEPASKFAVDPRGWEQVSDILYDNGKIDLNLLINKIGPDLANSFIAFVSTKHISLQSILAGNFKKSDLPVNADERFAFTISLLQVDEEGVQIVREFLKSYFGKEYVELFDSHWIEESDDRALLIRDLKNEEEQLEDI